MAQDESSSVVFGMPMAAIGLGAVKEIVPLPDVPRRVIRALSGMETVASAAS